MPLRDFSETLSPKLRDKNFMRGYLAACLAADLPTFYVGLRYAVLSYADGFTWLSRKTGIGRASLYRALSINGNPSFKTIQPSKSGLYP